MTEKSLLDDITKTILAHKEKTGKKPHFIYLGVDEMELLMKGIVFKMQNQALTPSKPWYIFKVEIVEVYKKSFLEVGEKNENS